MPFPRSKNPRAPWNGRNKWPFVRRPRKIPMRALSTRVARKRSEWGWIFNDIGSYAGDPTSQTCQVRCIEWGNACNENQPLRIPIITPAALNAVFDDTVTIAKMQGFMLFHPGWPNVSPCTTQGLIDVNEHLVALQWPLHLRAYLMKQNVPTSQLGFPSSIDPLDANDWTDRSGVLREWNHSWLPNGRLQASWNTPSSIVGVCSDVTRAAYVTPATASGSQPTFNVPAIDTTCTTVAPGEGCGIQHVTYDYKGPSWYRMNINRARPIDLKEDDSLDFWVNWSSPRQSQQCYDDTPPPCGPNGEGYLPCRMYFQLVLKVLYQYG